MIALVLLFFALWLVQKLAPLSQPLLWFWFFETQLKIALVYFNCKWNRLLSFFASRVFLKMFSQELGHIYAHLPVSRAGSFTAPPELRRTTSSKTRYSGLRSGKMNLEKLRRSRSESDSSHDEGVTLESVTDLQSRKDPERSMASSKMQCSAEVQWYRWPTLNRW